ncbi:MAG: RNA polymerase sigma factor [Eubacterium sp.]|nr:RNA polymerase sigma factor [Eubacterium sp.]
MDERQLIISAKQGDKDSFCELYSIYKDRLYRYALYRLGNPEDAEDAVSDCVLSAFKQIGNLKKPEAFSSWLFTILRASCVTYIVRQSLQNKTEDIDGMKDAAGSDMESTIRKTELQQALDILRDDEREIVLMSVVLGLNSKEIAKAVDMTSGAVRSKLSRSLKKMREFLGD